MRSVHFHTLMLCLAVVVIAGPALPDEGPPADPATETHSIFQVGVASLDITPRDEVTLAGSPSPQKTSSLDTHLFVKAIVISAGSETAAIVTLDTLKYPADLANQARQTIEQTSHIPASHIIICASHTHSGPLWSYYDDRLVTTIGKTVALAVSDLTPCAIGISKGTVDGVSRNRRILIDGQCWNRWQLEDSENHTYPAAGPADLELAVLAVVDPSGRHKAILYNYACHPANARTAVISADYPGHVQQIVNQHLGYDVPALFLLGSSGDVNPAYNQPQPMMGEKIGVGIVESLKRLDFITRPILHIAGREEQVPGRDHPQFNTEEVSLKWKSQLEHYRRAFEEMQKQAKPTYPISFTGIRIGDDFAIVTNPSELFCEIGMRIKEASPFRTTMVATLTNGACGYVPTRHAFQVGGYETWFGEHSFLSIRAGEMFRDESLNILKELKNNE